jgi:hypothetical protein
MSTVRLFVALDTAGIEVQPRRDGFYFFQRSAPADKRGPFSSAAVAGAAAVEAFNVQLRGR